MCRFDGVGRAVSGALPPARIRGRKRRIIFIMLNGLCNDLRALAEIERFLAGFERGVILLLLKKCNDCNGLGVFGKCAWLFCGLAETTRAAAKASYPHDFSFSLFLSSISGRAKSLHRKGKNMPKVSNRGSRVSNRG